VDKHLEQRDVSEWIAEKDREWAALTPEEQEARRTANLAEQAKYDGMTPDEIINAGYVEMAESLGKPGWVYRDLPRMVPELFYKFIELAGDENLHWITFANYGYALRGQVLISPDGMKNLASVLNE
jgi:hypothetical protein